MHRVIDRRYFLKTTTLSLASAALSTQGFAALTGEKGTLFSAIGMAAPLDRAALLKEQGAQFLTLGTADFLVPDQADDAFAKKLALLAAAPLPVLACNGFLRSADHHCVGPEANHEAILTWAETAFRRLKQAGGKFIVFGSSGARKLPDGWPREKADAQFVALLKCMGPLAEKHGVTVVVEQLQALECNYINHLAEGAKLIREAGHPHVRLLADLFHMAVMGDSPADLKAAMDVVVHVEIAEKDGRTYPGVKGDDFRPYFHVLRESGYTGAINIEGRGTPEQAGPAFREIAKQAAEV